MGKTKQKLEGMGLRSRDNKILNHTKSQGRETKVLGV